MCSNDKIKLIIRIAGIGLFILGISGVLPQVWSMTLVAAGVFGFIACGGGGG